MPEENSKMCGYELIRQGEDTIMRIDCENCSRVPSIEENPVCMAKTIEKLNEASNVTKIVFAQKRDYEYEFDQTQMLVEIAKIFKRVIKQGLVNYSSLSGIGRDSGKRYVELQTIMLQMLKSDPIGAYVELKRLARHEKIFLDRATDQLAAQDSKRYLSILSYVITLLEGTKLIRLAEPHLAGFKLGDREIYRNFFAPTIKPDFMFTKLMANYPSEGEELDNYNVEGTEVTIFSLPNTTQYLYHMVPPEFKLSEEKYDLLDTARKIMAEHKPKRSEFVDPERMRLVFSNVGSDLIEELAEHRNIKLKEKDLKELTEILVRYTVGFGLIEVLLKDQRVQDVTINSPMGKIPMFLVHQDYDDCITNIVPTVSEAESWASKLRMISARPLDEANPILDTELIVPGARARVAVISSPLNPTGLAYAFRRHRDKPWTLPLFINQKMLTPLAAGVISFIVDGSRTLLVAGTRSAGKTSLLGSVLVEIMRKYRIITIEDALELPTASLRDLGYNIQPMKVASALTHGGAEVSAEEGIRATLRLGDSCLIVGEVRSSEAKSLYEAMRVGALANVVAGTIHSDSPYGVFDRVVNDLEVPRTSFKATDIIVVANPVKSADGLHRWRRVTQITEVRKYWEDDPLTEGGFIDLFKYDSKTDQLEPSHDLLNGESEILKAIAGNVKEWAGNWDAVWDNIQLRAKIKETIVETSKRSNLPDLLEARFVILSNDQFHKLSDKVKDEVGWLDSERIFFEWNEWLKREIKRMSIM